MKHVAHPLDPRRSPYVADGSQYVTDEPMYSDQFFPPEETIVPSAASVYDLRSLFRELLEEIRYEFHVERSSLMQDLKQEIDHAVVQSFTRLDQAVAQIHTQVQSKAGVDVEDIKSHVVKTVGQSEFELKAFFEAQKETPSLNCQIDFAPVKDTMSTVNSHMKSVSDSIQRVSGKIDAMSFAQVPNDAFIRDMSSVTRQMKAVADSIQMVNSKIDTMQCTQIPNNAFERGVVQAEIQPVFQEVAQLSSVTGKLDQKLEGLKSSFAAVAKSTSDMSSVLNAVARIDEKLNESSPVFVNFQRERMLDLTPTMDAQPVLNAIAAVDAKIDAKCYSQSPQTPAHVDMTPVLQAIAKMEATHSYLTSDTGPFLDAVKRLDAKLAELGLQQPSNGPVLTAIATLDAKVNGITEGMRADLQPVMDRMERMESKPSPGINQVLSAVADIKPSVDMGPIIDAIYQVQTPMVDAVAKMDVRPQAKVDLQPVMEAITALQYEFSSPDLTPVANSIAEAMPHLQSISSRQLPDISERLSKLETSLAKVQDPPPGTSMAGSACRGLRVSSRPQSPAAPREPRPRSRSKDRSTSPIRVGGGYELPPEVKVPLNDEAVKGTSPALPPEVKKPDGCPQYPYKPSGRNDRYVMGSYVAHSNEVIRADRKSPTDMEGRTVNLYRVLQSPRGPARGSADQPSRSGTLETWYR